MLTPPRRAILFVFLSIVGLSEGFQGRLLRSSSSLLRLRGSWGLSGLDSLKVSQSSTSKLKEGTVALGVDYGTTRIGTATMAGWAARRLSAIEHPGNDLLAARQLAIVAREQVASVVVMGLPLNKDGVETSQALLTRTFAVLLASVIDQAFSSAKLGVPPVVLVDERFSSKQAAVNLQNVKKRGAYSGQLDDESACVILDQFFATGGLNGSAERVQPQGGVVQEAEVALAKAAAVAAMQEDYEERKEAAAERGELLRAPMEVSDFTGETEDQFDIDAFDLEGEIASRAAALDSSDEEGGTSVS